MTASRCALAIIGCMMLSAGTACAQTDAPAAAKTASPAASEQATAPAASRRNASYTPTVGQSGKDVVWVPTPQALVDRMLDMAQLTPQDTLVDLGSGDGITVITAAKRGAKARGIEFNPDMVALARRNAQAQGVADQAVFQQGDIFKSDFSDATVVTLFLLPSLNVRLRPTLLDMKPGTRVVSNSFDMDDWKPDETAEVTRDCTSYCTAYKWVVPAKVEGAWTLGPNQLQLKQTYQMLDGSLRENNRTQPITDARMDGSRIRFSVGPNRYEGQVDCERMHGTINGTQAWEATRARR